MNRSLKYVTPILIFLTSFSFIAFAEDITVYITKTGKKYHLSGCTSLSKSKIPISLTEAIKAGYGACSNCKPPTSVNDPIKEKPISEDTTKSISTSNQYPYAINGLVVSITDGDTLTILKENKQYKIRLNGIDCPETSQAFGQKAKEHLSSMIFSKNVDVNVLGKDIYDRFLGDIYVDGVYINSELIRAGFAWHYKEYSNDENLAFLELQARKKKVGLWQDSNPTPPWEYRKGQ